MNSTRQLLRIQCLGSLTSSVFRVPGQRTVLPRAGIEHDSRHCLCNCQGLKLFHGSARFAKSKSSQTEVDWRVDHEGEKKDKSLVAQDNLFERVGKDTKTKATFNKAVDVFIKRDIRRRGHVEFIYAALRKMPEFGVARDITVYNKLLDVFPKEVFVPRNFIQRMFNHYPRQQECGVQLLEQMESYGVMPNMETKVLLVQIFGEKGHPMRKFQRIMYWFPKFKHANPFPVPLELTTDPVELSRFSLTRIANDLDARVTVYQYPLTDISETGEEISQPHVIGIQSPEQRLLLAKHNPSRPVFVEGPFPLWLRKTCVHYYVLRAEAPPPEEEVEEEFDLELCSPHQSLFFPRWVDLDLNRDLGDDHSFDVDDLTDGPVYAMCMTGQGDQVTLAKWISGLQKTNPILGEIPTLFRLDSGSRELQATADAQKGPGQEQEQEPEKELEQDTEPESDRRDVHSVKQ